MRTWHVAHLTEKRHSPAAKAMRDFVLTHGGDYLRDEFDTPKKNTRSRRPAPAKPATSKRMRPDPRVVKTGLHYNPWF